MPGSSARLLHGIHYWGEYALYHQVGGEHAVSGVPLGLSVMRVACHTPAMSATPHPSLTGPLSACLQGGYVIELNGTTTQVAAKRQLQALRQSNFLDKHTRALFVEFYIMVCPTFPLHSLSCGAICCHSDFLV